MKHTILSYVPKHIVECKKASITYSASLTEYFTPIQVLDWKVGFDNFPLCSQYLLPSSSIPLYKAATNPATIPTNPPIPATIIGAPAVLTCDGLEVLADDAALLDFELVVTGADVVAGTLVVDAVTVLVDVGLEVEDTTVEVEVTVDDKVVVAEALARDAE